MTDTVTFDKMNPEAKGRWIEALRSGKFKQGQFELLTNDGCNCCLGVLAEINEVPRQPYVYKGVTGWTDFIFPAPDASENDTVSYDATIPEGYCGLSSQVIDTLINMNDDENKTFEEIADFIEENL